MMGELSGFTKRFTNLFKYPEAHSPDMKGSRKKAVMALAVAVMFLSSPLAFSPGAAQIGDVPIYLRVGMLEDVKTLNPIAANDIWTWDAIRWLYDSPVYRDVISGEPVPYIAVSSANCTSDSLFNQDNKSDWEPLAIAGQMTVHYKFTGVKFHDGHQMDIDDMLFSYGVAAQVAKWSSFMLCLKDDGGNGTSNYTATHWLGIKKLSDTSLRFYIQVPFYNFVNETLSPMILPKHIWGTKVSGQLTDSTDPMLPPGDANAWNKSKAFVYENPTSVGSGAFKFENRTPGVDFKISTWREHFSKLRTSIDGVYFKNMGSTGYLAGRWYDNLDYLHWSLPPTYVPDLINNEDICLTQASERGFTYLAFNMRKKSFGYPDNDPLQGDYGKPLREAVTQCINKKVIVERLLQGFGIAADGPVSPIDTAWYNNSLPQFGYGPDEAVRILADAGYKLTDPTKPAGKGNWWKNPDGTPIGSGDDGRIGILTPPADYDPILAQAGIMISTSLQQIGINAESNPIDFSAVVDRIQSSSFEMAITSNVFETEPPTYLHDMFHSSMAGTRLNYAGYQNSSCDSLIEKARSAPKIQERQKAIKDCQASIVYDQPISALYSKTSIEAYNSDRFLNWSVGPSGSIFSWRSLIGIYPHTCPGLRASLSVESPVLSEGISEISVSVTDQWGTIIEGARVELACTDGTFANGLRTYNSTTLSNGKVVTSWTAPHVAANATSDMKVDICLLGATKITGDMNYNPAPSKVVIVTVKPDDTKFLRVRAVVEPDVLDPGDTAPMTVTVRDQDGLPIAGATIEAQTSDEGIAIDGNTTTDIDGKTILTLTAPNKVVESEDIRIEISVRHPSFADSGDCSVVILLLNGSADVSAPCCSFETNIPVILGVIGVIAVGVTIASFIFRKKRQ
ncbi:MAG: ABC transporter substrate-binding protein [Methanobacteriota archaeon]